jgi:hypothetical protein
MITTKLDLGLAIAACVRGYVCKRRSDPTESMLLTEGHIMLYREHAKDCRIENSALWLDTSSTDWYIVGDDKTWIEKEIK